MVFWGFSALHLSCLACISVPSSLPPLPPPKEKRKTVAFKGKLRTCSNLSERECCIHWATLWALLMSHDFFSFPNIIVKWNGYVLMFSVRVSPSVTITAFRLQYYLLGMTQLYSLEVFSLRVPWPSRCFFVIPTRAKTILFKPWSKEESRSPPGQRTDLTDELWKKCELKHNTCKLFHWWWA